MAAARGDIRLGTLRLTPPIGYTLAVGAACLAILVGLAEGLARAPWSAGVLLPPNIGGSHEIAVKLAAVDAMVKSHNPPDCLIVGNSMVMHGVAPEVVAGAYQQVTGRPLTCYNFGLSGVNAVGAARLADILAARYHPRLIIFGTAFVDYVEGHNDDLDIPWVLQQTGSPSTQGWMEANLLSYRVYLAYTNPASEDAYFAYRAALTPFGQIPLGGAHPVAQVPIDRPDLYESMAHFQVSDASKQALARLLSLHRRGVTLAVVEMPLPPATLDVLGRKQADHADFIRWLADTTGSERIPLWPTVGMDLIPPDHWHSYTYMDKHGAQVFSQWLGEQLAAAIPPDALQRGASQP